jgi:hypothetical protein
MQEVGGSIPPGSTSLRPLGFGWQAEVQTGPRLPDIKRLKQDLCTKSCVNVGTRRSDARTVRIGDRFIR